MSAASTAKDKSLVRQIADAVLYEGYILYPYRPSSVKNQQRWNFGALCPESYSVAQRGTESSTMKTECLVEGDVKTKLDVTVRFLHLALRQVAKRIECNRPISDCRHLVNEGSHFLLVASMETNGQTFQTWQEAVEREVVIPQVEWNPTEPTISSFNFGASRKTEVLIDDASGEVSGLIIRTQSEISGAIEISMEAVDTKVSRLSVVIRNTTSFANPALRSRDQALMSSFVSTHTILEAKDGAFLSLLDPPIEYKEAATKCINTGTYPVLVGIDGDRTFILSSPIILYDYPQIAPQSAGDLFDGTEIDEILTLRIMTLTDQEKHEMRSADELARQLLERTESISREQLMNLHGVMRKG